MIFVDGIARNIPKTHKNWTRSPTNGRMCVNLDENVYILAYVASSLQYL